MWFYLAFNFISNSFTIHFNWYIIAIKTSISLQKSVFCEVNKESKRHFSQFWAKTWSKAPSNRDTIWFEVDQSRRLYNVVTTILKELRELWFLFRCFFFLFDNSSQGIHTYGLGSFMESWTHFVFFFFFAFLSLRFISF